MKITKISITIEPNESEKASGFREVRVIERSVDKRWTSVNDPNGMLPFEIRMANDIQELIVKPFNTNADK
jgi:hypothetical protein